jgi:hypothetical protein
MKQIRFGLVVLACSALSIAAHGASSSSSGSGGSGGPGGKPPGAPPEAIAACKGKTEGAEVSFTNRDGATLTGTCRSVDGQLAAMPKGGPGGPPPAR